jgi:hypothetical protein
VSGAAHIARIEIELIAVRATEEREQHERHTPSKAPGHDAIGCPHDGRDLNTKRRLAAPNQPREA